MKFVVQVWLFGVVVAIGIVVWQLWPYLRRTNRQTPPIDVVSALWDGSALIAVLFGNLMYSIGSDSVAAEFRIEGFLVVIVNHLTNLGMAVACFLAAASGWFPSKWKMMVILVVGGGVLIVPSTLGVEVAAAIPVTAICLAVYGVLCGFVYCATHTRLVDEVDEDKRSEAVGICLMIALVVGVVLAGLPLLGGWRLGMAAIGGLFVLLGVTYNFWLRVPDPQRAQWFTLSQLAEVSRPNLAVFLMVAVNFWGWVVLYTIPSLQGASTDLLSTLAVVAQVIAAALAPWAGRRSDRDRRRVGIESAVILTVSMLVVAIAPPALKIDAPLLGGAFGWWLCGVFFNTGEYAANTVQGNLEARLSLSDRESVRVGLVGLGFRFAGIGLLTSAVALTSGMLAHYLPQEAVGVIVGVVCTAALYCGLLRPMLRR